MKKRYIVGKNSSNIEKFVRTDIDGVFKAKNDTALNEVNILFGGNYQFSKSLMTKRETTGKYIPALSYLQKSLEESDFAIASIEVKKSFFQNLFDKDDEMYIDAMKKAGFSVLMNNNNSVKINDNKNELMFAAGSESQWRVYCMNNISVGIVYWSYNNEKDSKNSINEAKKAGAQFIFAIAENTVEKDAKVIGEAGADYIVMNKPDEIRPYYFIETKDGRNVPVVGSLGCNLSTNKKISKLSALLKVKLLRKLDGTIEVDDEYIPCTCIDNFKESGSVVVPTLQYYNKNYRKKEFKKMNAKIEKRIGEELKMSAKKMEIKNKNGFAPQVSIQEICEIIGVSPENYEGDFPIDKKVHSVVIRKTELDKDCVAVIQAEKKATAITVEAAKEAGAILVIAKEEVEGIPCLVVEEPKEAFIQIAKAIRKKYDLFTVGITGTVGKSTTTDLIKSVIKYDYNMLDVRGNYNYYSTVGFCVQKLTPEHTAYVQELHGGTKGAASLGSSMILPNACVITNIGDAHLSQVGTIHDVVREKLGIIDSLQPGGVLFVNNDNEYLQNIDVPVKVVRYAVYNQESDYYAQNVVDYGDKCTFQIVCNEGVYDAVVHCPGIHNVGNAIAAFAVGRFAGIEPHRIIAGISKYRTSGIRQNIVEMDGYKIVVDCFSATPDSMYSSMKSFSRLDVEKGGRRIAILGDVADLASKSKYWHREFGKQAAELNLDMIITLGEKAKLSAISARKCGMEAYDFVDREEFEDKIVEVIRPGDNLLFKSSHPIDLAKSVNNIFGIK